MQYQFYECDFGSSPEIGDDFCINMSIILWQTIKESFNLMYCCLLHSKWHNIDLLTLHFFCEVKGQNDTQGVGHNAVHENFRF